MIFVGRTSIDPLGPLPLAGYAGRLSSAAASNGELEANWIAWRETGGGLSLVLTLDTLFSSSDFEGVLRHHLAGKGVVLENLAVVASHTHFAPSLDPEKPDLGYCEPDYMNHVAKQVTNCVEIALVKPHTITRVKSHHARAAGSVYRRRKGLRIVKRWPLVESGIQMLPNPRQEIPKTLRVWRFNDDSGTASFALVSWPCHPVSRCDMEIMSADYVGALRATLRNNLGSHCPILFLPGPCGDIRPDFHERSRLTNLYPYLLHRRFSRPSKATEHAFDAGLCDAADTAVTNKEIAAWDANGLHCSIVSVPVRLDGILGQPQKEPMMVSALSLFGLRVLAAGAELNSRWLAELGWSGDEPDRVLTGYTGPCFGYLPTDDQIASGGYEVSGFAGPFGLKGSFDPSRPVGPMILKTFKAALEKSTCAPAPNATCAELCN